VPNGSEIPAWGTIQEPDRAQIVEYIHSVVSRHRSWAGRDENDTRRQVKQQINTWRSKRSSPARPALIDEAVEGGSVEQSQQVPQAHAVDDVTRRIVEADSRADVRAPSEIRRRTVRPVQANVRAPVAPVNVRHEHERATDSSSSSSEDDAPRPQAIEAPAKRLRTAARK
jgi:hypothetical protein